jgi:hypothetical protein
MGHRSALDAPGAAAGGERGLKGRGRAAEKVDEVVRAADRLLQNPLLRAGPGRSRKNEEKTHEPRPASVDGGARASPTAGWVVCVACRPYCTPRRMGGLRRGRRGTPWVCLAAYKARGVSACDLQAVLEVGEVRAPREAARVDGEGGGVGGGEELREGEGVRRVEAPLGADEVPERVREQPRPREHLAARRQAHSPNIATVGRSASRSPTGKHTYQISRIRRC